MATVLVVDDYADGAEVLARTLRLVGHDAAVVTDGEEALDLARTAPPDLMVLDVMMPGLDGYDVLASLRAERATAAVPVVMYSAHGTPAARARAAALGAQDYLVKGIATLDDLIATVDRLAGGR